MKEETTNKTNSTAIGSIFHMLPNDFDTYSQEQREEVLQGMADKPVSGDYILPFEDGQHQEIRAGIADNFAAIGRLKQKKKDLIADLNIDIKEFEKTLTSLSKDDQAGGFNQNGTVYQFVEQNGTTFQTVTVDPFGKVIETRPATPSEMQKTIYSQKRYA